MQFFAIQAQDKYCLNYTAILIAPNLKGRIFAVRQVLRDQLLQNPPGWEHSKGMRL